VPRILLVDDDLQLQQLLARSLTRQGHEVTVAGDGAQALRLADLHVFDLVITDLVMPEVEGIQLLGALKAKPSAPKIIAMSGGGRGAALDYLQMASLLGAATTLAKPFSLDQLNQAVATVLGSK
jgi:DNA-binding response OmpR family regulator